MLQKQSVNVPFNLGVDTKTDPFQIQLGKFEILDNSQFGTDGRLTKVDGFPLLTTMEGATTISTFNDSLVGIGSETLQVYSADNNQVVNSGTIVPLNLSSQSLVRRATSQTTVDAVVAENGLCISTWLDADGSSYYQVSDSNTGQTIVPAVALVSTATMSRCYVLGNYFIVTYLATISAATHLQYIAIPIIDPSNPNTAVDVATNVAALSSAYNGVVANNSLYLSWNSTGTTVRTRYLTSALALSNTVTISSQAANLISLCADISGSTPVIWVTFYTASTNTIKTIAYSPGLIVILSSTTAVSSVTANQVSTAAINNVLTIYYEVANTYSYTPYAKTDYISKNTVTIGGVVGTPSVILRSVGLASNAINYNGKQYMLVVYGGAYQPTYFFIDGSGNVLAKVAYSNGGGYPINQVLSNVTINDGTFEIGYLFKDLLAAVNKTQGVVNTNGVYSQTGINLLSIILDDFVNTVEIANNLHISGGFLWMYDGVKAVEEGFHVWPEDITATGAISGGNMTNQTYYYQVTYEWTDNQGNIHRSAPSVPISATVASGSLGSVTLEIPCLRLTYKTSNKVRIVIYRWSTGQQNYYRVTSISNPLINNPSVDSVQYVDTQVDSAILGNDLIYTTGGVIENIAPPSSAAQALFKSRLFVLDAENRNVWWYSKQVVQNVPAEFSDEFTIYVPPSTGTNLATGPCTAGAPMDDKLVFFKKNAIYYITGTGPDNTGINNDFSEPIFITSTVGCDNPDSIVLTPNGIMFQSDKGIWLLGRDLSTSYIGAEVQAYNALPVQAAVAVPETNQVRFTLDGMTLMYDYYYKQWGTFSVNGISSVIYRGFHTNLNQYGQIYQQRPGTYLNLSYPVLMKWTTGWIHLADVQGYQRAYFFYLLGKYYSPHQMYLRISYDYQDSAVQSVLVTPDLFSPTMPSSFGVPTPLGSNGDIENWRIFFERQQCQAFKIAFEEVYDPSLGAPPGAGLTLSGINLVVGLKKGYRPITAAQSAG